ncbi:hypothetical protein AVEN_223828-1 [Araneus ventricosus]|uniref:Uncharacterized protein n=1 Tax=Araneus ventricosus TaxID=182803 RepID=A0A4Y2FFY6_ARAVE|nr:hypothetical protein AVEN_223828-1 [Araneus ventricosus]
MIRHPDQLESLSSSISVPMTCHHLLPGDFRLMCHPLLTSSASRRSVSRCLSTDPCQETSSSRNIGTDNSALPFTFGLNLKTVSAYLRTRIAEKSRQ